MEFKEKVLSKLNDITTNFIEREVGEITMIENSIVVAKGIERISYNEKVVIKNKYLGYVAGIEKNCVKIVILDNTNDIKVGDEVRRTNDTLWTTVGESLIGRVVDGMGRPLDDLELNAFDYLQIERDAKGILERSEVNTPLETGIKVIDSLIPIGKGQRELILGDRQTGKTSIAIDAILNQKDKNVICIYCSIGQRDDSIVRVIDIFKKHGAMDYTIIVNASPASTPGMQCITPFSATSMAEYFCNYGKDVLIVYDDLTKHARAYREISLLLEKTPGREAFPGDIFYLHARLLERSVKLLNGGSITSLPIIETEGENMSAYIPTNVISITDGQLYLSPALFSKGNLPAIDIGKSVSRVGSKAQFKALKQVAGKIEMEYSQFEELEMFSKFSTKLDNKTQKIINKGKLIREILKQDRFCTLAIAEQVAIFMSLNKGVFDNIDKNQLNEVIERIIDTLKQDDFKLMIKKIKDNKEISEETITKFTNKIKEML
ncbi:MAG: F0F1 ATP synthase subunit alpha [Rickettsiales bacterium]|jgi:F-type H+-transporting ATPase subunit alpha|nr:F0F1 ATP synthase subunit alpha [Rickettsiales bacterium]